MERFVTIRAPMPGPPSMFDAPRPANSPALADNYIQPNLNYGLRIWWAFYWRTLLSTAVFTFAFAFFVGMLAGARVAAAIATLGFYAIYYLAAFVVMYFVLRKNFSRFRIGLLSQHGGPGAQLLEPNFRRTARVWWTFSWRSVVYRIIAAVIVMFPLGWVMGFLAALAPGRLAQALLQVVWGCVLDGAIGMFVIYSSILDEDLSDFRVALLPRAEAAGAVSPAVPQANPANT